MNPPAALKAGDVAAAVRRRYGAERDGFGPEWACLDELTLGRFGLGERRADLFLVRAWPGQPKGHERHLVEVKVSRADLRAELSAPEKMAVFAAFAHRVYFATPAGLVKDTDQLGPGVGLLEVHPSGTREIRRATRQPNPDPMPEKLVVEVFRRAGRAEARTRTATAGEDPAARVVALEAELATARRAQYTAQDAARRDAGRLTEWLRKVSDAGGVRCKCGGTIKPRRDTYQLGGHRDGTTCPLRWVEPDYDALAVSLGLVEPGTALAS